MHDGAMTEAMTGLPWGEALLEATLDGFAPSGLPRLAMPDGALEEARSLVALGPADAGASLVVGRLGPSGRPVVLGRLLPPRPVVLADEAGATVIEARERLELRCGPASLTLHADGRVEVRGTQILSRSDGANRVQGATVLLN